MLFLLLLSASNLLFMQNIMAEAEKNKILILGDSLSAGYGIERGKNWVDLLAERLAANGSEFILVNSSISGDTTANGLSRLQGEIERHQPVIIIIELGANDGLRGMPLSYIQGNLEKLIHLSLNADTQVLLVGMRSPPNYGKKYTQQFHSIFTSLAQQQQINLLPFLLEGVAGQPELIQADGLHPNQEAQPRIMQNVWEQLSPMLSRYES